MRSVNIRVLALGWLRRRRTRQRAGRKVDHHAVRQRDREGGLWGIVYACRVGDSAVLQHRHIVQCHRGRDGLGPIGLDDIEFLVTPSRILEFRIEVDVGGGAKAREKRHGNFDGVVAVATAAVPVCEADLRARATV